VDTFEEGTSLADEASGGNSVTGTTTAEESVPDTVPASGEEGQSIGEEAASDGAGNQDRSPR